MSYAIVYCSKTGNTQQLALEAKRVMGEGGCSWCGSPSEGVEAAIEGADMVLLGSWTDKGGLDADLADILPLLDGKRVFVFGTCGFGGDESYYARVLSNFTSCLPEGAHVLGSFMCQGRMPMAVRERYVKMAEGDPTRFAPMIENFDRAAGHPNEADLEAFGAAMRRAGIA